MRIYNGSPTLTDTQVLDFCKKGFLILEAVVPDAINRRVVEYLDKNTHYEPTEILQEEWFVENVILNAQAAGAVRSLLGKNFHLPILMSNHRGTCPLPAGGWHVDGNSKFGPELNYLQVFYYPQACSKEWGPTELLPGSHFYFNQQRFMSHLQNLRGVYSSASPAGSIFITAYQIWHRRSASAAKGIRNLLKYFYWRTVPPERDWVIEPGFNFATANYELEGPKAGEQFRSSCNASEMFFWLCGQQETYRVLGGQSWPLPAKRLDQPYGFPFERPGRSYVPQGFGHE
ncbi:MAG: hypothetical protein HYU36_15515 [Planctomycetes bacterium]|nr:hypothetical protein [Planctomycetota bacterium]